MAAYRRVVRGSSRLGQGATLRGRILGCGDLLVEGSVCGDIELSGDLYVGRVGRIRGSVRATRMVVDSCVEGPSHHVDSLWLRAHALMAGEVEAASLRLDEGALLWGTVTMRDSEGSLAWEAAAISARDTTVTSTGALESGLGHGLRVEGDLEVDGDLVISAFLRGSIRASGVLTVESDARVEGPIQAQAVWVKGRVAGMIRAQHFVRLMPGARVEGDLLAGRVVADAGAHLEGRVRLRGSATDVGELNGPVLEPSAEDDSAEHTPHGRAATHGSDMLGLVTKSLVGRRRKLRVRNLRSVRC